MKNELMIAKGERGWGNGQNGGREKERQASGYGMSKS